MFGFESVEILSFNGVVTSLTYNFSVFSVHSQQCFNKLHKMITWYFQNGVMYYKGLKLLNIFTPYLGARQVLFLVPGGWLSQLAKNGSYWVHIKFIKTPSMLTHGNKPSILENQKSKYVFVSVSSHADFTTMIDFWFRCIEDIEKNHIFMLLGPLKVKSPSVIPMTTGYREQSQVIKSYMLRFLTKSHFTME